MRQMRTWFMRKKVVAAALAGVLLLCGVLTVSKVSLPEGVAASAEITN